MKIQMTWLKPSDSDDLYIKVEDLKVMMKKVQLEDYYDTITGKELANLILESLENVPNEVINHR